jgi:hypothetical protein
MSGAIPSTDDTSPAADRSPALEAGRLARPAARSLRYPHGRCVNRTLTPHLPGDSADFQRIDRGHGRCRGTSPERRDTMGTTNSFDSTVLRWSGFAVAAFLAAAFVLTGAYFTQ